LVVSNVKLIFYIVFWVKENKSGLKWEILSNVQIAVLPIGAFVHVQVQVHIVVGILLMLFFLVAIFVGHVLGVFIAGFLDGNVQIPMVHLGINS
jgi:hypothetical protein